MLDLNLVLIQVDLKISLKRFAKICEIVQTEIEKVGLGKKYIKDKSNRKKT